MSLPYQIHYVTLNLLFNSSRTLTRQDLVDYVNSHYKAPRMVLSAAGGGSSPALCTHWGDLLGLPHTLVSLVIYAFFNLICPQQAWTTRSWSGWPNLTSAECLLSMRETLSLFCRPADLQAVRWEHFSLFCGFYYMNSYSIYQCKLDRFNEFDLSSITE